MSLKVDICGLDTQTIPRINSKETKELLLDYKNNNNLYAKEKLIMSNLRLVLSIMQRFPEGKVQADDLFQAGCVGLIKAIDNFNCKMDVKFSTYAVPMIMGEMRKTIRESSPYKVNRAVRDIAYQCIKAKEKLSLSVVNPTLYEVAAELKIPEYEVISALDAVSEPISIYSAVYQDNEDGMSVIDQIAEKKDMEENAINKILLKNAINNLPPKEKIIINMRYYMGKTQVEISNETGISQAQISRLEKNALKEIKKVFI